MKLAKFINTKKFDCSVYYKFKSRDAVVAYFNKQGKEFYRCELRNVTPASLRRFKAADAEEIIKNEMQYV